MVPDLAFVHLSHRYFLPCFSLQKGMCNIFGVFLIRKRKFGSPISVLHRTGSRPRLLGIQLQNYVIKEGENYYSEIVVPKFKDTHKPCNRNLRKKAELGRTFAGNKK